MTPAHEASFKRLALKHAVEATVMGRYTDTGILDVKYQGRTAALLTCRSWRRRFPPGEFEARWLPPEHRLTEPVLGDPGITGACAGRCWTALKICSREWITRQYDHEVQGASVIKPLVGGGGAGARGRRSVAAPAGFPWGAPALSLALNPAYSPLPSTPTT